MSTFYRFPGGLRKALTLSYDDGVEQDVRLMEILDQHGIKCTFNLNSGCWAKEGTVYPAGTIHRRMSKSQVEKLYKNPNHEVAAHCLTHASLTELNPAQIAHEVLADRENLEAMFGGLVRGLAYPFGTYSDTALLRELLNEFADDQELAACWNMYATCAEGNEDAETTITNLGAYVHHVHIHDYRKVADRVSPELIGEGELPLKELMNALRSVNYDGFISLQWDPAWIEGIDDIEIILTHFHSCMRRYRPTRYNLKHLQWNKAHTGRYVWEKEKLIDKTFPEVLDRMVEEFPDQTAIKFTTLDYTRTYSQFRDDVDEFARALVSLGVKAGSKVTICTDPLEACKDADVLYTDVWASMGQEGEAEKRREVFKGYQINDAVIDISNKGVMVQHCLPAHRGEEITANVFEAHADEIFEEAENRLHAQKAVMVKLMAKSN